jgi:hypothetical protein
VRTALRYLHDRSSIAVSLLGSDAVVANLVRGSLPAGAPISLLYMGDAQYAREFELLLSGPEQTATAERVFRGSLIRYLAAAQDLAGPENAADVIVRQAGVGFHRRPGEIAHVPFLHGRLQLGASIADQIRGVRSKAQRRRLRTVLRSGAYRWTVSTSAADFDLFYEQMYAPYVRWKFGPRAHLDGRNALVDLHRRAGRTLLVREGAEAVCGALLLQGARGAVLMYHRNGFRNGETWPAALLASRTAALELAVIEYGIGEGFRVLDVGFTRAILCDGLFVHKRRLGCSFVKASYSPTFFVRVRREARPRFLAELPLLGVARGGFVAHLGYGRGTPLRAGKRWHPFVKNYAFRGLRQAILHTDAPADDEGRRSFEGALRNALGSIPLELSDDREINRSAATGNAT